MIQRVQTIWLLLAAVAGFLTTQVPLYTGHLAADQVKHFYATESLLLFAVAIISALLGLVAIFLFKNRSTQIKFAILGLLTSIILIALEVFMIGSFQQSTAMVNGTYYWGSLFPIAMLIFFFLAIVNIRKDNKLIKSLDRLR